jgi:hypothetical protein
MDTLAVRCPDEIVEDIDRYIDRVRDDYPMMNVTRADAVRMLLAAGIEAEKKRLKFGS